MSSGHQIREDWNRTARHPRRNPGRNLKKRIVEKAEALKSVLRRGHTAKENHAYASPDHSYSIVGRSIAYLAIQLGMGLLPRRWAWDDSDRANRACSGGRDMTN